MIRVGASSVLLSHFSPLAADVSLCGAQVCLSWIRRSPGNIDFCHSAPSPAAQLFSPDSRKLCRQCSQQHRAAHCVSEQSIGEEMCRAACRENNNPRRTMAFLPALGPFLRSLVESAEESRAEPCPHNRLPFRRFYLLRPRLA